MKKTLFVTVLLFCSVFLFSQGIYKPGLVVGNAGDTLKGWVKYANWKINPSKIEFKTDSGSRSAITYSTKEIQYFEVVGLDVYKRVVVRKDMRSVDPLEITRETTDSTLCDTVFLRTVVSGKDLNLYEFVDFKNHYYLKAVADTVEELSYKLSITGQNDNVSELNDYKEQLRRLSGNNDSPAIQREIENARYTEKDLARIVADINGKGQIAVYGEANKKTRMKPQFFASAGAGITTFNVTGSASNTNEIGLNYQATINPVLSIGMDLLSPRNFSDFTFRIEIAGSMQSYKGKMDNYDYAYLGHAASETYTIKQQNITPSLSVMYNFRRTQKVKFYAGLGLAYNLSSYSMNRYVLSDKVDPSNDATVDDPIDLEKLWLTAFLRAGVRLDRKFEIGLVGDLTGSFINYENIGGKPRTYTLKFVYFFL